MRFVLATAILMGLAGLARAQDSESTTDLARKAAERSLPYLEEKGIAWMNARACITCHQTTFLVWTHNEAARRGIKVDARSVREWTNYALLKAIAGDDGSTPSSSEALSQLLQGRDAGNPLTAKPTHWNRTTDPYENVLKHLLKNQSEDGSWKPGGQSRNPPEIPTGWAVLALASREELMKSAVGNANPAQAAGPGLVRLLTTNNEALPKSRERGLAWLKNVYEQPTRDLTEVLVLRLLVEKTFGTPERTEKRLADLLGRQQEDGGWSADPKLSQPSDAFATGQSLYALSLAAAGDTKGQEACQRAIRFLSTTQQKDGSWQVLTSAFHPADGRPTRDKSTDDVYTYWGTAWGTLGLLHTLPLAGK